MWVAGAVLYATRKEIAVPFCRIGKLEHVVRDGVGEKLATVNTGRRF